MIEIDFRMSDWHLVDGTLDNTGAIERVGGDEALAEAAHRVRAVAWAAAAEHPRARPGWGWPPPDDELAVALDRADWEIVVRELRRWADVADRRRDDDGPREADGARRVAGMVEDRLDRAAPGGDPAPTAEPGP